LQIWTSRLNKFQRQIYNYVDLRIPSMTAKSRLNHANEQSTISVHQSIRKMTESCLVVPDCVLALAACTRAVAVSSACCLNAAASEIHDSDSVSITSCDDDDEDDEPYSRAAAAARAVDVTSALVSLHHTLTNKMPSRRQGKPTVYRLSEGQRPTSRREDRNRFLRGNYSFIHTTFTLLAHSRLILTLCAI